MKSQQSKKVEPDSPAWSPTMVPSDDEAPLEVKKKEEAPAEKKKVRRKKIRPEGKAESAASKLLNTIGAAAPSTPTGVTAKAFKKDEDNPRLQPFAETEEVPSPGGADLFDAADPFCDSSELIGGATGYAAAAPVREVHEDEIVQFLRQQEADSATYRQLAMHFRKSEDVRKKVESMPGKFVIDGDRVTLSDPRRKQALAEFAKEIDKKAFHSAKIVPEKVVEHIYKAAQLALEAYPADIVRVLHELCRNIQRKAAAAGPASKTKFSASMPIALACLVDRIVMLERRQGGPAKFENTLSARLTSMIFKRWTLGVVPGSEFLTNLLFTWEQLGYFKAKHLTQCGKPMALLLAYARSDGVPDKHGKITGTGWYGVVRRDRVAEQAGCQAIMSKEVVADVSAASQTKAEATDDRRGRTKKAAAQMGLGPGTTEEPAAKRLRVSEI